MKLLITGAQGQVGSALVRAAQARHDQVCAYSRAALDITDKAALAKAFTEHKPDWVINAAAYTAVDKAEAEPQQAFAINALAVKSLAEVCKAADLPLVHLSTDYVFDGSGQRPYLETDPTAPLNVYGETKAQGELALQELWPKHLILRVSWVFGEEGNNFVKTMLRLMQERTELKVVTDQRGGPTYAGDIARAILQMIQKPVWGLYHFAGSPVRTWYEFAQAISVEARLQGAALKIEKILPIPTRAYPTPAPRPLNSVLNTQLFQQTFGAMNNDWRLGLKKVIAAYLA